MTTPPNPDRDQLFEEVLSAHRARDQRGGVRPSAAFHDLDPSDRLAAFDEALKLRAMEASLDPDGKSTSVNAVLRIIEGKR